MSLAAACAEAAFAYRTIPFFTDLLDSAGIAVDDIDDEAGFRRLPCTTKASYRRGFPARVVNPAEWADQELVFTSRSSGTTGDRLITVVHRHLLAERMLTTAAFHPALEGRLLGSDRRRVARLAAPNCSDVECATPFTTMADRILPDGTLVLPVSHDVLATPPVIVDQIVDELLDYQPAWLYADPTHLAFLCERLAERGITELPGSAVVLTYSMCARPALRTVTAMTGPEVPVAEVLSMSEFGWLGMECPAGARHLNTENFYPELLDGERPIEVGEIGELVVTSLGDQLSPHVRYRTGDLVEYRGESCSCGAAGPLVRHHGRAASVLRNGSGVVTGWQLDQAVGDLGALRWYRVDQSDPDTVRCRAMVRDADHTELVRLLDERLRDLLDRVPGVEVSIVPHIEAERSGKFAYCAGLGVDAGVVGAGATARVR